MLNFPQVLSLSAVRADNAATDELGVRYMARAGNEPYQLGAVMPMLEVKKTKIPVMQIKVEEPEQMTANHKRNNVGIKEVFMNALVYHGPGKRAW